MCLFILIKTLENRDLNDPLYIRAGEYLTQEQTAKAMGGWSREAVKDYKALKKICDEAWQVVGASFGGIAPDEENNDAPDSGANAPKSAFSENLLRNILDLESGQQVELVWKLTESFTQEQTAKAMGGWSRAQVSQYAMLNKIDEEAWNIVATSFKNIVADSEDDSVADSATGVAKSLFSENLLRNILDLESGQQVELVWKLTESFTQEQTAKAMGWSNRVDVSRYKSLKALKDAGAWDEIIVPTFKDVGTDSESEDGTEIVPNGTKSIFTERLLREILDLESGPPSLRSRATPWRIARVDRRHTTANQIQHPNSARAGHAVGMAHRPFEVFPPHRRSGQRGDDGLRQG